MRTGTETAQAGVVTLFGTAKPHRAYLFANRRTNCMKVWVHEEPFGPIAGLMSFDHLADGLKDASRLPYGLSACALMSSARTAIDVVDRLEAGMIGINQYHIVATELPFGGMKESGHGSEGGIEGVEHYLTYKFISQV